MYVRMVREESQGEKISKKTQEEVYRLLEGEGHESRRFEGIRDKTLLVTCMAEENGFVMGFKYAFRLFTECMRE